MWIKNLHCLVFVCALTYHRAWQGFSGVIISDGVWSFLAFKFHCYTNPDLSWLKIGVFQKMPVTEKRTRRGTVSWYRSVFLLLFHLHFPLTPPVAISCEMYGKTQRCCKETHKLLTCSAAGALVVTVIVLTRRVKCNRKSNLEHLTTFFCGTTTFLTLTCGECGAPDAAPHAHHQRISHQVVAFVALELHSASCVQVVFLQFTIQYLFRGVAAFGHWHEGKEWGLKWRLRKQKRLQMYSFSADSILCTFTCGCRLAPRAVGQTGESLWTDQLQAHITNIAGIVEVSLSCCLDLSVTHGGRRSTGRGWGHKRWKPTKRQGCGAWMFVSM